MKEFFIKQMNDLLSRSFLVLLLSIWLYVSKLIDLNFFCVLNGFNYGGSGLKNLLDNSTKKDNGVITK